MLTGRSDGYKLKPFVLLPLKRPKADIIEKFKNKLHLSWAGTNWMNDDLTSEYLQCTFGPGFFANRLLVWDSFRCHISKQNKKKAKEIKLDMAVIPGGCTKFIQVSFSQNLN